MSDPAPSHPAMRHDRVDQPASHSCGTSNVAPYARTLPADGITRTPPILLSSEAQSFGTNSAVGPVRWPQCFQGEGGRLNARPGLSQIPGAGELTLPETKHAAPMKVFCAHRRQTAQDIESPMKQFDYNKTTKITTRNSE
jgi:hypothetical protein